MKKVFTRSILSMLIILLVLTVISTNVWSAQGKPIKLLYGSFNPPKNFFSKVWADYAKELAERSNGRVEMQFNWAMAKPGEFFELTKTGVIDFGFVVPGIHPGTFELTQVTALPWVLPSAVIASKAVNAYYKKGYMDKGYDEVKVLWCGAMSGDFILLGKKPVKTIEDFKGMKISAGGSLMGKRVKLMGGVPTYVPFPEQYTAMTKGIIDGTVMGFNMMEIFRLFEVSKNALAPPMGTGVYAVSMNKKRWNSLPPDIQAIMDDISKKYVIEIARAWDSACMRGEKLFLDNGGQIHELKQEDLIKTKKMIQPIWQDWIEEMEKKGFPGKKAVNDMYAILKNLGIESPAVGYTP